ncbi:MAG: glycosyltransferase family 9 protein [Desulfarculus sp.]|nr:glycosyltransferase family 9 protein [Desulfarculus sp.]
MPALSRQGQPPGRRLSLVRGQARSLMVIQLARLGDFLQTTPLLAALRASHPQARIAVAVAPAVLPLARACRHVDQVHILDPAHMREAAAGPPHLGLARLRGLCEPLWAEEAQEVYNLNLSHLAAGLAAGWSGARLRGWRPDPARGALTGEAWTPFVMHMVSDRRLTRLHLCDILASYAQPHGPPATRLDQRVEPQALAAARALLPSAGPRVVLQLGANHDLRRWPLESFAQLARGLAGQGARLVITGAGGERPLGHRLAAALGPGAPLTDLMGQTDLPTLAGVLAQADLVVSADTGTLHLATAVGARVLALFMGPAQAHETGPYGPGHLVLQARDACGPCLEDRPACQGQAPCRRLIGPAAAFQAGLRLLHGAPADLAAAGLDLPPGVEALAGEMDGFGQRYRPLAAQPLDQAGGLALALRQAGRRLLRPSQAPGQTWRQELRAEHLPPGPDHRAALAGLSRAAGDLARAAAQADQATAQRLLRQAPGLGALARLVGPDAPPGLEAACREAAEVLALAADL